MTAALSVLLSTLPTGTVTVTLAALDTSSHLMNVTITGRHLLWTQFLQLFESARGLQLSNVSTGTALEGTTGRFSRLMGTVTVSPCMVFCCPNTVCVCSVWERPVRGRGGVSRHRMHRPNRVFCRLPLPSHSLPRWHKRPHMRWEWGVSTVDWNL